MKTSSTIVGILCFLLLLALLSGCGRSVYTSIAAGDWHACALSSNGSVFCWGDNGKGQLGDGTMVAISLLAVKVRGVSGVTQISAAGSHTCALTGSGKVFCWGENRHGELNNGNNVDQFTAAATLDLGGKASGISANTAGACAALADGRVSCWGDQTTAASGSAPADQYLQQASRADHSCAVDKAGGVLCWGRNSSGQLGDGTTNASLQPVKVVGLSAGVDQVAVGDSFSCALLKDGSVKCWGDNYFSQLGTGSAADSLVPVDPHYLDAGVSQISAGVNFACALEVNGSVLCWGTIDNWNISHPSRIR